MFAMFTRINNVIYVFVNLVSFNQISSFVRLIYANISGISSYYVLGWLCILQVNTWIITQGFDCQVNGSPHHIINKGIHVNTGHEKLTESDVK